MRIHTIENEIIRTRTAVIVLGILLIVASKLALTAPTQSFEQACLCCASLVCFVHAGIGCLVLRLYKIRFISGPNPPLPNDLAYCEVVLRLVYSSPEEPELFELMPFSASCFLMFLRRSLMIGLFSRKNVRAAS